MSWLGESASAMESGSGTFDNPEDNVTPASSIQGPVQLPYYDIIVTILGEYQSTLLLLVSFIGMLLNVLLLVLMAKYKKFQTLEFGLAAQIVVAGIIGSFTLFLGMLNSIANRRLFGVHMCQMFGAVFYASFLVRAQSLLIFMINRFTSVFLSWSCDYSKHQKSGLATLSLVSWVAPLMLASSAYIYDCYDFQPDAWVCYITSACSMTCGLTAATSTAVTVAPSATIPVFLYTLLFVKARNAKKAMTLADGERKASDWNDTIKFFIMFLSTFALALPNLITALSIAVVYEDDPPLGLYLLYILAISLSSVLPVVDAIVILRNRDVKDIIMPIKKKIFQKLCKK